jgi:cytochrome c oxidase cbb3-type subunit 3
MTKKRLRRTASAMTALTLAMSSAFVACSRQERRFSEPGTLTGLPSPARATAHDLSDRYLENAWSLAEGQRSFEWYNCRDCHGGGGGGGIGPPLSDGTWIYGSDLTQVFTSIADGRPNGMPAFRGHTSDSTLWQTAAFVLSLSGRAPQDVAPGRNDSISGGAPPAMRYELPPRVAPEKRR